MKTLHVSAKLMLLALVAVTGISATASTVDAAKKQAKYRYVPYYVVSLKHYSNNTIFRQYDYWSLAKANKHRDRLNRESWEKCTPVIGRPFYRDVGTNGAAYQVASIPDKLLAGLSGVHIGKVEVYAKQAVVRIHSWHKQRIK